MKLIQALVHVSNLWSDPEIPSRSVATMRTLAADNRFTEEAIAFAVNQQLSLLNESRLEKWANEFESTGMKSIGVLNPGNIPFVELQDLVATLISGHRYLGSISSKTPFLLQAFLDDLLVEARGLPAALLEADQVIASCDRLIASGSDSVMQHVLSKAEEAELPRDACWLRGHRYSVAVLDGRERNEALLDLAEDALLHEGMGCRSVALVFAPKGMDIDPVLDAFATYRGLFPAHSSTRGALKMQRAFLKAVSTPHAFADDDQFLISRGEAEAQLPGHVRWVEYESLVAVESWLDESKDHIQCVFSDGSLRQEHDAWQALGTAQRPALDWEPDGRSHASFLSF
ncbi:MAG: hypothetical protein P8H65_07840 [Rhodothermales bacterium]|nr:hypothetical protein [Rhodothermales bacterium]MDG2017524.1 hypothetical protein [Rhodothermales bacterium]HAY36336.1 hypothetical protein [Bacteroidota bacterium]